MKAFGGCVLCVLMMMGPAARADIWDTASDNDDTPTGTENELVHGTIQMHDVGPRPSPGGLVPDQDWFRVAVPPFASFEVVFDTAAGYLGFWDPAVIQRLDADGVTVVQGSDQAGDGPFSRRLAWKNGGKATETSFIGVHNLACGASCLPTDQYRVVARETTVYVARFNNLGTQVTVLMSQNASNKPVQATYYFWSETGALLWAYPVSLGAQGLNVLNTSSLIAVAGQAGSVTIAHDGPYGTLNVKSVALEPATGFSFDTPGVIRTY